MRKIIYALNVSLDGYIEDQNGSIDWTAPSKELHEHFNERENEIDTHLYGRNMYQIMQFWEDADQDSNLPKHMREYAHIWQQQKKIVFSTTLETVDHGYELKHTVDPKEINEWKKAPGKNMFMGGATLAASFLQHGLLDEVHLYILPVLLGGGKSIFPGDKKLELKFMENRTFPGDVVKLKYRLDDYLQQLQSEENNNDKG